MINVCLIVNQDSCRRSRLMEWGWSRVIEPVLSELSQCSSPDPRNLRVCAKWLGVRCPRCWADVCFLSYCMPFQYSMKNMSNRSQFPTKIKRKIRNYILLKENQAFLGPLRFWHSGIYLYDNNKFSPSILITVKQKRSFLFLIM